MSQHKLFQVDLRGIIDLLSDHLYSGPEVYVRELLQNAVDALVAREQLDPSFVASSSPISVEVIRAEEGTAPTLVVSDRGIGLTEDEIHRFLATIGNSSKRDRHRDDFLGQFGIGLLSGFMVADQIVVTTRSVKPDSSSLKWVGNSDGTYQVERLEQPTSVGTVVYLRAKPGCFDFVAPDVVHRLISRYGSHLPIPIEVIQPETGVERVNVIPPWQFDSTDRGEYAQWCLDYAEDVMNLRPLGVIPIQSEVGGVTGIAYLLPHASRINPQTGHRVYLKGMLLSESVENLMPRWAFFVRAVVNATKLNPSANRESLHDDATLDETRFEIGQCLKQYLMELSEREPGTLENIIELHHLSMKALALEDDDFFDLFVDWLPFETSLGTLSLGQYRKKEKTIQFVSTRDEFRQIVAVAGAQGICIINAGYTYDQELLMKLQARDPSSQVHQIDTVELAQEFSELSADEKRKSAVFLEVADQVLEEFNCRAVLRSFRPESLPALYTSTPDATFLRSIDQTREISDELWSSVLESVGNNQRPFARAQLCMNLGNPLVFRLISLDASPLLVRAIQMLYVQSLLLGHYPLGPEETSVLSDGLVELIDHAVRGKA